MHRRSNFADSKESLRSITEQKAFSFLFFLLIYTFIRVTNLIKMWMMIAGEFADEQHRRNKLNVMPYHSAMISGKRTAI